MMVVTRNEIQTTISTHLGNDDLFYTTTVTLKNVGEVSLTNLICKYFESLY